MFTTRRPRRVPNSTAPATSANSVSSPPRPTPSPGWKWVPRWRTMISPALTSWPPKRLTPSRCAFESRPLRVEDAPFLCAMSGSCLLEVCVGRRGSGVDRGDLDLGQVLTVALTLLVAGLVLVLHDRDLGALGGLDHLGLDGDLGELVGIAGHGRAVDDEERGQRNAVAGLAGDLVDDEDITDGDLLLAATCANDRVHG